MRLRYRRILIAAGAALASMALVAPVAQAAAPAPPYQDFAGCPSPVESEEVAFCFKQTFVGGHIDFGNRQVPVTNPIVLHGGLERNSGNFIGNSEAGIDPVRQTVPGGLIGLTGYKWLDELAETSQQLKLYATVELAGQPGSHFEEPFTLPIKIHLENPFLGNTCYIGSNTNPINLALQTTKPAGALAPEAERPAVRTTTSPGTYADSTYAVPAASGCKLKIGSFSFSIDEAVNSSYELPAATGNEALLDYNLSLAFQSVVYP